MKKWKRWLALLLLLLVVMLAWLFWPSRRMARAQALRKELTGPEARSLSPEQRREKWQKYRELTKTLTPAQRDALSADSRKRRQAEMARYFAMSPDQKKRYLDERIKDMEKMRQQMQGKNGSGGPKSGTRPGASPGGASGPPTNGTNGTAGAAQPSGRDRSVAGRDHGRQDRLDSTTPAERAMFTQFVKDVNDRRGQLGLPPMGRGFGPPR